MALRRERRRLCKFLFDWTESDQFSSWLTPVKGDNHKAYCLLCKKVFAVSHGGLNDVKAHYKGKRHIHLQRQQQETAEESSNLWEGHQNFRSKNVGQNIVFNEKTEAFEKLNLEDSKSLSSIGEDTVDNYDSADNSWFTEFGLTPESIPIPVVERNRLSSSTPSASPTRASKMNSQLKMMPQQYCLRWKYHHNNLQVMFSQLLERESYCDVTIACEGKTIRAHKMVLSACSTYFDAIFSQHEEKNPIVILKDVKFSDIKALVDFMYKGEINVDNSHLTSLLKTAEDLHIKGLAEVSWRSDRTDNDTNNGCEPSPYSHVETMGNGSDVEPPTKRKREEDNFNPMVMSVTGAAGTENAFTVQKNIDHDDIEEHMLDDSEPEIISDNDDIEEDPSNNTDPLGLNDNEGREPEYPVEQVTEESLLQRISAQYQDVVKLNDYLTTGRRQQFWEEPFTRRVMEAIKGKELEMKVGAELLGVSYGTLYGRYRDAYGCLKHPYRVRDFWSESGPADILAKVQRKEITLFRAAEMLNVTVTTLANYLSTLRQPGGGAGSGDEQDSRLEDNNMDEMTNMNKLTVKTEPDTQKTNHDHPGSDVSDRDDDEVNGMDNEPPGSPR